MRRRWAVAVAVADSALAGSPGAWPRAARLVTKPAVVPAIAATRDRPSGPLAVALAASWAGDVALLSRSDAGLLGGVGSFAVAHVAYLTAIRRQRPAPFDATVTTAAGAVLAAAGTVLWRRLDTDDQRNLRLPVLGYAALVVVMGATAVRGGLHHGDRGLAAGGALFVLSDTLVAATVFGERRNPAREAAVMVTYAAAQALLAGALSGSAGRPAAGRAAGRPGRARRWPG